MEKNPSDGSVLTDIGAIGQGKGKPHGKPDDGTHGGLKGYPTRRQKKRNESRIVTRVKTTTVPVLAEAPTRRVTC